MNEKKKAKKSLCVLLTILILIISLWYFNNYTIRINKQTIYSSKVNGDIRITVILDLHGTSFGDDNSMLLQKIKNIPSDLIFVLGDMYSRYHYNDIGQTVEIIKSLAEISPVYIITGDHDTDDSYKEQLKKLENVKYLAYEVENITVNGNEISIYGIDNVYFTQTFDLNHEFEPADTSRLNILLAHIPEYEHYESFGADIIFSGDTHGGLIRLPYFGGIYYDGYIFPKLTFKGTITDKGLYKFDSTSLFVTSGLGAYPLPLRINNRPEICSITISKGE